MSYTSGNVKMVDRNLVEKILEQGQRLRNAMVGSILKNDPFNTDIIYNKQFSGPVTSRTELSKLKKADKLEEKLLQSFMKGEYLTREEEKLALDTLRSMSAPDLYKTTEKSLSSPRFSSCKCFTCETYKSNNLCCDLRRQHITKDDPINKITRDIQEKYKQENFNSLKYIDSLKVSVNSLILNETGNQKVLSFDDKKVPYLSQNYFLEYSIPENIINKSPVSKSKVDSGLENNYIRVCSRRNNDTINFKQVTIHDVKNLEKVNLDNCEIKFKISFRSGRQKNSIILGYAKFNFASFLQSKNLTCSRGLMVYLNENTPITVGTLKVSLQLGCGRLYFGQEFVDAISFNRRNSVILDSDDSASQLTRDKPVYNTIQNFDHGNFKETYQYEKGVHKKSDMLKSSQKSNIGDNVKHVYSQEDIDPSPKEVRSNFPQKSIKNSAYFNSFQDDGNNNIGNKCEIGESEKDVLFGFLYISEAQYLSKPLNSYITCKPFYQNTTSSSKLVLDTFNPIFNFQQVVPLIFEDDLLFHLRENYMILEFWHKTEPSDTVIGLTKLPLHQFYLAYRNSVLLKYLNKNKLPVIGTDWWEPIYRVDNDDVIGQVQVLVALGTEQQINNLKSERGFANTSVKAKHFNPHPTQFKIDRKETVHSASSYKSSSFKPSYDRLEENRDKTVSKKKLVDQAVNTSLPKKSSGTLDVGTQSDMEADKKGDKTNNTQEMLGTFLNQLMSQRLRNTYVENSTNTDMVDPPMSSNNENIQQAQRNTNVELRKTTDLLDSLQKALSLDGVQSLTNNTQRTDTFKVNISINSANHLPSRKKCKSKRSKSRSVKNDENILPSCYVTFETVPEGQLKITPVVSKSISPIWNYKCNVHLPIDLLTNSQKRLIFKIWRKATNTVMTPNMQTDIVLGFAAVDLTVLLAGLPNVQGWFNIIDFSGKCNGQINIHITPLENLSKYELQMQDCSCNIPQSNTPVSKKAEPENEPSELLSRALKRKFTELDEITQRLRLRLSKVTNEDSDNSSDGAIEEFERDINTLCVEDDFDLINFEDEARKFNKSHSKDNTESGSSESITTNSLLTMKENKNKDEVMKIVNDKINSTSSVSASTLNTVPESNTAKEKELFSLDQKLQEGKQKIDTLLEKLSLLSTDTNNPFTSRYVSGCSLNSENPVNIDTEAILVELDHNSRPNIQLSEGFDPISFQQLYAGSICSNSAKTSSSNTPQTSNSDTSLITNFSDCRLAPDGQGNLSDDKVVKNN